MIYPIEDIVCHKTQHTNLYTPAHQNKIKPDYFGLIEFVYKLLFLCVFLTGTKEQRNKVAKNPRTQIPERRTLYFADK